MNEALIVIGLVVLSYLFGSIPFGYIIARAKGVSDIRKMGSGSTGGTNIGRHLGKKWGILVALLDALKCAILVFLGWQVLDINSITALAMTISAVLGHIYPVWLKFRAGKGVATALGGLLVILPVWMSLVCLLIWLYVFTRTKYVSQSNLILLLLLAIGLGFAFHSLFHFLIGFLIFCLIAWAHRENIERLAQGKEPKSEWLKFNY